MGASRQDGDLHVAGNLSANSMTIPNLAIDDSKVSASAAISQSKLQHQHRKSYAQPNSAATTETRVLAVIYGATGTVLDFRAGSIAIAAGGATVTLDLKKNGVSILTGVITLDTGNAARVAEAGSLTGGTALVAGDVLEVVITATAGGGTLPTGVFCALTWKEDAA